MKKIDLIIDALLVAESSVWSEKIAEALTVSRGLKALKPVAWMLPKYGDVLSAAETQGVAGIYNIPLYALDDEVTE